MLRGECGRRSPRRHVGRRAPGPFSRCRKQRPARAREPAWRLPRSATSRSASARRIASNRQLRRRMPNRRWGSGRPAFCPLKRRRDSRGPGHAAPRTGVRFALPVVAIRVDWRPAAAERLARGTQHPVDDRSSPARTCAVGPSAKSAALNSSPEAIGRTGTEGPEAGPQRMAPRFTASLTVWNRPRCTAWCNSKPPPSPPSPGWTERRCSSARGHGRP